MKNFEKILKENVVSLIDGRLDPLQFAYQAGKGVNDAKLFILDTKAPWKTQIPCETFICWFFFRF